MMGKKDQTLEAEALGHRVHNFVQELQTEICQALAEIDGRASFREGRWSRPGGGGGNSATIEDGAVFEKGGVNVSAVHGELPQRLSEALNKDGTHFYATGISLVIHPRNPHVPTVHANFRYFALGKDIHDPDDEWFGGGADLTPYYPYLEDAQHFHRVWKEVCDEHSTADYGEFKRQCDDYFYLPHRDEARGVGGIFFDYLRHDPEETFTFVKDGGRAFLDAYVPIVERRVDAAYGDRERTYQELRRGRYVEFNLLFDRGTKFGIETRGRTESILMSLPPHVQWRYDWQPEPGSLEERARWFFHARDWFELYESDVPRIGK